jgi:hypothetical protein
LDDVARVVIARAAGGEDEGIALRQPGTTRRRGRSPRVRMSVERGTRASEWMDPRRPSIETRWCAEPTTYAATLLRRVDVGPTRV